MRHPLTRGAQSSGRQVWFADWKASRRAMSSCVEYMLRVRLRKGRPLRGRLFAGLEPAYGRQSSSLC